MKLSQVRLVYRKEIMDILRDRRTLYSMIVAPLLVVPLFMFGLIEMSIRLVSKAEREPATVQILGAANAPTLSARLRADSLFVVLPPTEDYAQRIENKELRLAIEFPPDFEKNLEAGVNHASVKIFHYEEEIHSEMALRKVQDVLRQFRDEIVEKRLAARDLSVDVLQPFDSELHNVASAERVSGAMLGGIIPYIIILLSLTGAMVPAIDLTAGEKERATIETILASPVSRASLATGKFLTVLSASITTAVLSILMLLVSSHLLGSSGSQLGRELPFILNLRNVLAMLLLLVPVAVLFSSALLAIALMAKSYREAQSYIQPLMIVVILPAVAAMLPGVELDMKLALVPILNVSLIGKELMTGIYDWPLIGVIFGSSCLYAGIALKVAIGQFQRESVLFRT